MKRYDLNLLTALDVLLQEKTVSGAARRLGVGQPAMSAALARLRTLLDDPIVVRSGSVMKPTARARDLAEPLRNALARLDTIIEPARPFDPASRAQAFRISGGDYIGMTVLPGLAARLASAAPLIDLRFRFLEKDAALAALEAEAIDLALLVMEDLPAQFGSEILIRERFVGAARTGHPIFHAAIDAARLAAFNHVLVTERGDASGSIDEALRGQGLARRVAVTVPSVALVADLLRATDLVATVPRRSGHRMAAQGDITLFDPPVETRDWGVRMVWAVRNAGDPALIWLRGQLSASADAL